MSQCVSGVCLCWHPDLCGHHPKTEVFSGITCRVSPTCWAGHASGTCCALSRYLTEERKKGGREASRFLLWELKDAKQTLSSSE